MVRRRDHPLASRIAAAAAQMPRSTSPSSAPTGAADLLQLALERAAPLGKRRIGRGRAEVALASLLRQAASRILAAAPHGGIAATRRKGDRVVGLGQRDAHRGMADPPDDQRGLAVVADSRSSTGWQIASSRLAARAARASE